MSTSGEPPSVHTPHGPQIGVERIRGDHLLIWIDTLAEEDRHQLGAAFEQALTQPGGSVLLDLAGLVTGPLRTSKHRGIGTI